MDIGDVSRRKLLTAGAAVALAGPASVLAQPAFPSKPIRMILPFPAGGSSDGAVRMVADRLSKNLGVQVLVDNKAGAEGILAVSELRSSPPDGHTIMFGSPSALLYVPLTRRRPPYDALNDLQPVTHFTAFTYFLFVNDTVPAKTFEEFAAYVRSNPGKVAYGAGDATGHMVIAQMAMHGKLDMTYVPYRGVTQAFQDFAGGRIQLMVGTIDTAFQIKDKGRAIAVFTPERSPLRPEVPTMAELGFPQVKLRAWTGFFAPAQTPMPVVNRLAAEFDKVFSVPELQQFFSSRGSTLKASTPQQLHELLVDQMPVWREAIAFAKVPIQD